MNVIEKNRIVDAQVHIWAADSPERPWPTAGIAGRTSVAQRAEPLGASELLAEMDAAGIDRVILVPPSWEGDRNDLVAAAAVSHPDRFAFMGRLDPFCAGAADRIAQFREQPGALGLRFILGGGLNYSDIDELDGLWSAMTAAKLSVMLAPRGKFSDVARIAVRHPQLCITIDHLGTRAHQKDASAFADHESLLALAVHPNISVKASGLPDYSSEPFPHANIHGYVRAAYDAFGASRFFFGSDLTRLNCGYAGLLRLFESFSWLTGNERRLVMGEGILQWLDWQ